MIQFTFKQIIESVFIEKRMQPMTLTEQYYEIEDNGYINDSFSPTASNAKNNHASKKSGLFLVTPTSSRELSLATCILLVVCFDFLLVSICLLVMHLLIK